MTRTPPYISRKMRSLILPLSIFKLCTLFVRVTKKSFKCENKMIAAFQVQLSS